MLHEKAIVQTESTQMWHDFEALNAGSFFSFRYLEVYLLPYIHITWDHGE